MDLVYEERRAFGIVFIAQACAPADYSKPFAVKSHNEVLRCFAILYLNFPDRIINFLLAKLSPNVVKSTVIKDASDRSVVGALTIINKLVNQQGKRTVRLIK